MQTSLQLMHTCVQNWTQTTGCLKPYKLRSGQPSLASLQRKTKVKRFEGSGSGRDWQALSSSILDTHLHQWLSWRQHKKRRMWCLHQVSRQTSILCVSTCRNTVFKLQSWSPRTAECHRNHHFMGREAQENSLPHRLTVSPASPHVWWTWHNTEAHTENISSEHPLSIYLYCSSVNTSTHWLRGDEIADQLTKEGREKEQPLPHLAYREVKTLIPNTKKTIFHSKAGGHNPNQDTLHQLPRHQQTTIFCLRTGHCRLNSHLKRIGIKTSAQCPCGEVDQTAEHYLQSCLLQHQARQQIWPSCVFKTKLWGSAEDQFGPDIQVCGTHGRKDPVNATITSNAKEEEEETESLKAGKKFGVNYTIIGRIFWYRMEFWHIFHCKSQTSER